MTGQGMPRADRIAKIKESVTMAFDKKAKDMKARFPETIILAAGEPDFAPPLSAILATASAAQTGQTKYTLVKGNKNLLDAIAVWVEKTRGLKYDPLTQVMATVGGKEALYLGLLSTVNEGDEVLIVSPYWTSYPEMVILCGGIPHFVDYKDLINLKSILENSNIKALILNSPGNPSGMVIPPKVLGLIAAELKNKKIWVISDEIYSQIIYGNNVHKSIASFPGMADKTLIVDGASKAFAMTGYRLGYALGPRELIADMAKGKSQINSCTCSISQAAVLAALQESAAEVEKMRLAYEKRLNTIILPFVKEFKLEYLEPQGAFYLFFKIPGAHQDCLRFCEELLEKEKLGLVPGLAFGYPGWVRISFAASDKDLIEGLKRLGRFLKK
jgi:aspartate aminotransferase